MALYKQKLDTSDERSVAISQSVEAFVCYQLMYKKWWNYSETSALTNNTISNGHHLPENSHNEDEAECKGEAQSDGTFSEGLWKVLLSEPHANLQATQRAIAEIQRRVTSLIQQHSQCKETRVSPEALSTSQSETSEEPGGSTSGNGYF